VLQACKLDVVRHCFDSHQKGKGSVWGSFGGGLSAVQHQFTCGVLVAQTEISSVHLFKCAESVRSLAIGLAHVQHNVPHL
jgi:hypothetical protein